MAMMKNKGVSFNLDNPQDKKRHDFIEKFSFSEYVKSHIDKDMEKQNRVQRTSSGGYQIRVD